jgi:hypothetical protein
MNRKTNKFALVSAFIFISMALLIIGCATPRIKPITKTDFSDRLPFLITGSTTREEVLLRLGEPSGRFEGERILTYILSIDSDKKLRTLPRQLALSYNDPRIYALNRMLCSLVLVFEEDNVLEKTELICSGDELE